MESAADDYHLAAESVAIDAGEEISSITDDLDGLPRPDGEGYDIGAYEYQSVAPDDTGDSGDSDTGETSPPEDTASSDSDDGAKESGCATSKQPSQMFLFLLALLFLPRTRESSKP